VIQQYVGMSVDLACNIVLVVHPTKLKRDKEGKIQVPEGDEIADSVHFFSRTDTGITIHRPNFHSQDMLVRVWKARNGRFASYGDTTVRLDPRTFRIWPRPVEAQAEQNRGFA
jgi:hypothetical protein